MNATMTIRAANDTDDLTAFALYSEDNAGVSMLVVEGEDGNVVAFCQHSGMSVYFIESNAKGAGTALVDYLKAEYGELEARNVSEECAGFWEKQGFWQDRESGERVGEFHYIWYEEE